MAKFTSETAKRAAQARNAKYAGTGKLAEWGRLGHEAQAATYPQLSAWGKRGARAVIEKYGADHWVKVRIKAAEARLSKPLNGLEQRVANALAALDEPYQREVVIQTPRKGDRYATLAVVDFLIPPRAIILAHGDHWHKGGNRRIGDQRLTDWLRAEGYNVLILWEDAINRTSELFHTLGLFLSAFSERKGGLWIARDPEWKEGDQIWKIVLGPYLPKETDGR